MVYDFPGDPVNGGEVGNTTNVGLPPLNYDVKTDKDLLADGTNMKIAKTIAH